MSATDFYREPAATIAATIERLEAVRGELDAIYARWDELDSRRA